MSDIQAETAPEIHPDEKNNDNVSRALFFKALFSAEDIARLLALPPDAERTHQFEANEKVLMPGYASYMRCRSHLLPITDDSAWLIEHVHAILSAVNARHFGFAAARLLGTRVLTLEAGMQLDWHSDLGAGMFSTRKITLLAFLTPLEDYAGGEFELMASPYATMRREQGAVVAFPSFSVCRLHPVTQGRMQVLMSWLHGEEPFQ